MTRGGRRTTLAFALFFVSAAAAACSALVGVEDVQLRKSDAAIDDAFVDPESAPPVDGAVSYEASVQLAAGFNHNCARKGSDGKVLCWGENGGGQLGDGISFDAGPRTPALVPQDVVGINDAVFVAAGVVHTCVVHRTGAVSCWGVNSFGALGNATLDRSSSPVTAIGVNDAVSVACGTDFTCAVLKGGGVSCWGANYSGQLGDGTKIDRSTAASVLQLTGVVQVATGEEHACALLGTGAVECWGKNADGQLGNGNTIDSLVPTPLGSLSNIAQIVAAARFTCARNTSGQVFCWGSNQLGELGTGTTNGAPNPSPAVTNVTDAIALWTGYEHACAVRRNGAVQCWGAAGSGQVGSGSVPDDASIPRPTAVIGIQLGVEVSTGGTHSCATTRDGAVFCWGENSLGQLGNGNTTPTFAAVPVSGFP